MPSDGLSFEERREQLRQLLNGAHQKLYREHEQTYGDSVKRGRLSDTMSVVRRMFENTFNRPESTTSDWFWESIAISQDNPRQMSYSWSPDWRTDDSKRKRSSVSRMLSTAVHKGLCNFSPQTIDLIAQAIGQYFPDTLEYSFRVVSGKDVCLAYRDSLDSWGSCMSRHWNTFVRWYAENPEKVSLVRINRGEEYCGRALLWTLDGGERYLDKCYPSNGGAHYRALQTYAEEQGWVMSLPSRAGVTMRPASSGEYPYVDTFKYTDDDPEGCVLLTLNPFSGDFCFNDTEGDYEGRGSRYSCDACGRALDEDETYTTEHGNGPFCERCYLAAYVYLSYRNAMTGERREGEYSRDEVICCDECGQERDSDDVSEVEGRQVCCNCYEDCVCSCAECEESVLVENAKEHRHELYCEDCFAEVTKCSEEVDCTCDRCLEVPEGQPSLPIYQEENTNGAAASTNANTGGETDEAQAEENPPLVPGDCILSWSGIIAGFPHRPGAVLTSV